MVAVALFKKHPLSTKERIEALIMPIPMSGCWVWMGTVANNGYGQFRSPEFSTTVVHRILYEQRHGPIPQGLECDHLCRVRCCVNPDHIELVTRRENIRRGVAPIAAQMLQTHCKNGHPLEGDNLITYKTKYGIGRRCRICREAYDASQKQHRKEYARKLYLIRKGYT